jgi:plasmid stabilization system protein ParE
VITPPRIVVMPGASEQLRTIQAWWKQMRPSAPDLFLSEFEGLLALLRRFPSAGRLCVAPGLQDVRRLLLRRTAHHVYYRWSPAMGRLAILAIRHAARHQPPALDDPGN